MDEIKVLRAAFWVLKDAQSWSFESDGPDFSNYCDGVLDLVSKLMDRSSIDRPIGQETETPKSTENQSPDGYGVGIYA